MGEFICLPTCSYRISSNRRRRLPSNSIAAQSKAIEQNKRCPRIVAAAIKRGTQPHVRMISDDSHTR